VNSEEGAVFAEELAVLLVYSALVISPGHTHTTQGFTFDFNVKNEYHRDIKKHLY
jgi:hypothetical protein